MTDKTQFYWAIIGDANPEPVAVTTLDGKRVAYTIGCPDPFDLDSGNIELVESSGMFGGGVWREEPVKLSPPEKLKSADHTRLRQEAEMRLERDKKRGISHGWRRWNP